MNPLKPGDRVAIYHGTRRTTGEVIRINELGHVGVIAKHTSYVESFCPQQLRRLRPKREIWVGGTKTFKMPADLNAPYGVYASDTPIEGWTHFVESRRKRVNR